MSDFEAYRIAYDIIQGLVLVALTIYTWVSNRTKVNTSAINRVDNRVTELAQRTQNLETRVSMMPGDKHIHDIYEKVNRVVEAQAASNGQLQAISRQLEMINQHLLKGDK